MQAFLAGSIAAKKILSNWALYVSLVTKRFQNLKNLFAPKLDTRFVVKLWKCLDWVDAFLSFL
ncbi:hypothetical protein NIES593_08250 [Hydrococcus rivularis NIES-593]|uniref:Uncharacterized protein n=1 Tax=Hydrococcus rivularis NIES-593 TaxID=1921803 RepID=A0A1U7HKN9_9CYAN|nr:hypothetical protein NIES593_08250 [Hydrococcus rivularis NIES-593]